jgi:hypothetical protein
VNQAFFDAIVDTLLPGDGPLPAASAVGLGRRLFASFSDARSESHPLSVIREIARRAGGADFFTATNESDRVALVAAVEIESPEAFRKLAALVLADYCETDQVLAALGWRSEPPQPQGHLLPTADEAVAPDASQPRIWRMTR